MPTISRGRYRRGLVPPPQTFYENELGELRRPSRDWAKPKDGCPFHPSKSKQSFAVNLVSGAYHCFGCGASGGDIVDFVRLRDKCDFRTAAQTLGAWDGGAAPVRGPRGPVELVLYLVLDVVIDGTHYRAEVEDKPRNSRDRIRRFYREASDRLQELGRGDRERYDGEQEDCWARMESAQDELRELEGIVYE